MNGEEEKMQTLQRNGGSRGDNIYEHAVSIDEAAGSYRRLEGRCRGQELHRRSSLGSIFRRFPNSHRRSRMALVLEVVLLGVVFVSGVVLVLGLVQSMRSKQGGATRGRGAS